MDLTPAEANLILSLLNQVKVAGIENNRTVVGLADKIIGGEDQQ